MELSGSNGILEDTYKQQQRLLFKASWGKLEMEPNKSQKQGRYLTHRKKIYKS